MMTIQVKTDLDKRMEIFKKYLNRTNMTHNPYQMEGVRWCLNNELCEKPPVNIRGGIIADEMGLGKTIVMIGTFLCNIVPKTLIVLPVALIEQWFNQIHRTTGHKPLIYHGSNRFDISLKQVQQATIVLTSYNTIASTPEKLLEKDVSLLHLIKWDRIVFDEAHHLRNGGTARLFGSKLLMGKIRWMVTGTPIQNKKQDFFTLCSALKMPASFYTNNENNDLILSHFILKRTKKQVGINIPDIHISNIPVVWKNEKEKELSEEIHCNLNFTNLKYNKDTMKGTFLGNCPLLTVLMARQSCVWPKLISGYTKDYTEAFNHSSKLDSVVDLLLSRKDNGSGKLIFCHFRKEIDEIQRRLREGGMEKVTTFDGRTSHDKRSEIISDKNDAIILQIQTGCEGLNLQENYSEIYFVSPNWNPAMEEQAIARCHRIGQTKPVYVFRFIMEWQNDNDRTIINNEYDTSANETINAQNAQNAQSIDTYIKHIQESKRTIATELF